MEIIGQWADDHWQCLCGNKATSQGFYPCDSEGKRVEPTPEAWTTDCYVCMQCGRIIQQSNRQVVGMCSIPFQCPGCDGIIVTEICRSVEERRYYEWQDGCYVQLGDDNVGHDERTFVCYNCGRELTAEEQSRVRSRI
jgi:DNA-directed RNA polymerase subunit RPC12/RpoP